MPNVALLTQHEKAQAIIPAFENTDYHIFEYADYDTDLFGTFCNSVERKQDAKETALLKAKKAIELTGSPYGMGTEGSFTQQFMPGVTWEQEIICLYHLDTDAALYGFSEGPAAIETLEVSHKDELQQVVLGMKPQKWMLFTPNGDWLKGLDLTDIQRLTRQFDMNYPLTIYPDYRAMHCPSRRIMIASAARNLAQRINSLCPKCGHPNFVYEHIEPGLPCEACGLSTQQAMSWYAICESCGHKATKKQKRKTAPAKYCAFCNP